MAVLKQTSPTALPVAPMPAPSMTVPSASTSSAVGRRSVQPDMDRFLVSHEARRAGGQRRRAWHEIRRPSAGVNNRAGCWRGRPYGLGVGSAGVTFTAGGWTATLTDLLPLKVPFAQKKIRAPTISTPTMTPRIAL